MSNVEWKFSRASRIPRMAEMSEPFALISDQDVVLARQVIRNAARQLGLSIVDQTKIVTAVSELARNAVIHGGGGSMYWEIVTANGRQGLRLTVSDKGPGIQDLNLAMKDGWTSGSGLGMGLPGAKRLVNEFHIDTKPGVGTTIVITRWK
jgi:serine/threonine-protein kinase RsbT